MKPIVPALAVLIAIGTESRAALAGECYPIESFLPCGEALIEVEMIFDKPIPRRWPNRQSDPRGWRFPGALASRAKRTAKFLSVDGVPVTPASVDWDIGNHELTDSGWWAAHSRGRVRAMIVMSRSGDKWRPLGLDVCGFPNNIDKTYAERRASLRTAWQARQKKASCP